MLFSLLLALDRLLYLILALLIDSIAPRNHGIGLEELALARLQIRALPTHLVLTAELGCHVKHQRLLLPHDFEGRLLLTWLSVRDKALSSVGRILGHRVLLIGHDLSVGCF